MFEPLAKVSEVPDQGVLEVVRPDGERLCLIRRGPEITAVGASCTHQEFEMSLGDVLPDGTIQCAWHGARFDCATGEVRQGPASDPLPIYEVRVDGDHILVGTLTPRAGKRYSASIATVDLSADPQSTSAASRQGRPGETSG